MSTWVEKSGFTQKQAFALVYAFIIMIGFGLGGTELMEVLFDWGKEALTEEDVVRIFEEQIDQGLGGSPYQTEKPNSFEIGIIGSGVGRIYYALSGTTGKLVSNNVNATLVFQYCVDNGGGLIYIHDGNYTFSRDVDLSRTTNVTFQGESWNTMLYMANNAGGNTTINSNADAGYVVFRDLQFHGNKANQGGVKKYLANIRGARYVLIDHIWAHHSSWNNFRIDTASDNVTIQNSLFTYSGQHGIVVRYSHNVKIVNNMAMYNLGAGINVGGASRSIENLIVSNNNACFNTEEGIHVESDINNAIISDNTVLDNLRDGIRLTSFINGKVSDNLVNNSGYRGIVFYDVSTYNLLHLMVSDNMVLNSGWEGISIKVNSATIKTGDIYLNDNIVNGSALDNLLINGTTQVINRVTIHGGSYSYGLHDGMTIQNVTGLIIDSVRVMGNNHNGTELYKCFSITISDCHYRDHVGVSRYAIATDLGTDYIHVDNCLFDGNQNVWLTAATWYTFNGMGHERAAAEEPQSSYWDRGNLVNFTDTGDATGDGVYVLLNDGVTWIKVG